MVTRTHSVLRWLGLLGLTLALGCAPEELPRTQLMLVVTSELAPSKLQSLEFLVADRGGVLRPYAQEVTPSMQFPLTLAVLHQGGSLGPVRVGVRARDAKGELNERIHSVRFEPGRTLVVPLDLAARCFTAHNPCAPRVCTRSGCSEVELYGLDAWRGAPPGYDKENDGVHTDAGSVDAGRVSSSDGDAGSDEGDLDPADDAGSVGSDAGKPSEDAGPDNGRQDAGQDNGRADAGVDACAGLDLRSDPYNCGACGHDCRDETMNLMHIEFSCVEGRCIPACLDDHDDCDGNLANGCETNLLTSKKNCGECGHKCKGPRCEEGLCMGGSEG